MSALAHAERLHQGFVLWWSGALCARFRVVGETGERSRRHDDASFRRAGVRQTKRDVAGGVKTGPGRTCV